ncbi:MAG: hypothetical protein M3198_08905 [Actinomycetota bacterium]|nr:hypothetical protein [Actinomycetota bacterium]
MSRGHAGAGGSALWRALLAVAFIGTLAAGLATPIRSSHLARTTGDEPQYLLTAISVAEDRSLDIADEHASERYRPFHEIRLAPQAKLLSGGRMVSPHDPLLPLLLALPVSLGGWFAAKLGLAVLAGGLAAVTLWVAVRRFGVPALSAAVAVGVFAASAPLAIYGSQVYPEVPAALAFIVGVACLTGALRPAELVALGASVVVLPWLSIKFVPVAAALAILGLLRLRKEGRMPELAFLAGALAIAAAAFLVGHLAWYGGVTPYAAGSHFADAGQLSVVGRDPNVVGRSTRLIGLLVDRTFGLGAWQPAWILVIPALAALVRLRPPRSAALVVPLAVGWLTASFVALTMHGWWWPGRQVVVVLPAAVVLIAWWASQARGRFIALAAMGAMGVANYAWLLADGWSGRITLAVDFHTTRSLPYRLAATLLPDYQTYSAATWFLHGAWVIAAVLLAAGGARYSVPGSRAANAST